MILIKRVWLASRVMLLLSLVLYATRVVAVGQFRQENRPENLKALLETIQQWAMLGPVWRALQ